MSEPFPWPHGGRLLDDIAVTNPAADSLAVWHIGQSGFVVKGGRTTLYFDPFLAPSSSRLQRTWEPPFRPDDVRDADIVFCTHDHLDHLDPVTIRGVAQGSPHALVVVPPSALARVAECGVSPDRVVAAQVDQAQALGAVSFQAVPASHGDSARPFAEAAWEPDPVRGYRFVGFVVDVNGVRLYHAGDTVIYPGMVERLAARRVDLALLPINGRDWFREQRQIIGNTDAREAADLGHAIGADVIVPMHYDMFAGNPGSPAHFVEYCTTQYPGQGFHVPIRCKRWIYVK